MLNISQQLHHFISDWAALWAFGCNLIWGYRNKKLTLIFLCLKTWRMRFIRVCLFIVSAGAFFLVCNPCIKVQLLCSGAFLQWVGLVSTLMELLMAGYLLTVGASSEIAKGSGYVVSIRTLAIVIGYLLNSGECWMVWSLFGRKTSKELLFKCITR